MIKRIGIAFCYGIYNSVLTFFPSFVIRHAYLRHILGIRIGKRSSIGIGCFIAGKHIRIGDHCVINRNCLLDGRYKLTIENNVSISPHVKVVTVTHDKDDPNFGTIPKAVVIKDYAWVGIGALILPGVTIEKGAIIGAGSVVTKNVGDHQVVAGNPAKVISQRETNLNYQLEYFPLFHSDVCL